MPETLFPPLEPYASGMLPVSELHSIYYEECGNPDGVPVVMLHGGPDDYQSQPSGAAGDRVGCAVIPG